MSDRGGMTNSQPRIKPLLLGLFHRGLCGGATGIAAFERRKGGVIGFLQRLGNG